VVSESTSFASAGGAGGAGDLDRGLDHLKAMVAAAARGDAEDGVSERPAAVEPSRDAAPSAAPMAVAPASAGTVPPMSDGPASRASSGRPTSALILGLAAAAAAIVVALVVFVPWRDPAGSVAALVAEAGVGAPVPANAPAAGILVITAVPWGEVVRVTGNDGSAADLPDDRVTPLRLWVAPGTHEAEVTVAGGGIVTCRVDVAEGSTHLCQARLPGRDVDGVEYFKEMGWWQ
jgi:hypothetical protein